MIAASHFVPTIFSQIRKASAKKQRQHREDCVESRHCPYCFSKVFSRALGVHPFEPNLLSTFKNLSPDMLYGLPVPSLSVTTALSAP